MYTDKIICIRKPGKERLDECFRVMATIFSEAKIGHRFLMNKIDVLKSSKIK